MRMRYERRDPRPEDMREIEELKGRVDSQDRDLCRLTEKLRELQNQQQQNNNQNNNGNNKRFGNGKQQQPQQTVAKLSKSKVNCNVIYEENEDRDVSPAPVATA